MTSDGDLVSPGLIGRFRSIVDLIGDADRIAISGHTSPDGDSLGSVLGLGMALRAHYPLKTIDFLLADNAPVPRIYRFMEGSETMVPACTYTADPDLFIVVDAPVVSRIADAAEVLERSAHVVAFDHHPSTCEFAEVSVRKPSAAACAVLIQEFLSFAGISLTKQISTALLCGIVTDTGRFQFQNADPAAFVTAAELVGHGGDPARVSLEVYQSQRIEYLRLESIVMARIRTVANGRVAYSYAYASDLERCGVSTDECDGLVDVVRSVMGVEVCLFLKGTCADTVRGNLRSKGAYDVSTVAAAFGGGGHVAASGFTYKGSIEQTLRAALPMLADLVGEDPSQVCVEL